ncbi:MAG: hypothetical protein FWB81_02795 [Cystobacterineae bacterium]|nr:hypothetical protein [Cystobacterineae bacterium]
MQFLLPFYLVVIPAPLWCILPHMRRLSLLLLAALAFACAPSSETPLAIMVLAPNANGLFEPQPQQLTTIENISKLEGSIAHFIGGARMFVDANNPKQATGNMEQYKKALFKNEGSGVRAQFIEKDGVLWPADFHSWAMVTAYWNLEQAFLYFNEIYGKQNPEELLDLPVYYWLDTNALEPDKQESNTDNAFFSGPLRMMAVLPFKSFQTIPMSINLGVMAHEYAHFVLNARVYHLDPYSPIYTVGYDSENSLLVNMEPQNILGSIDEGLADLHAYGVIRKFDGNGMANFIAWSLDETPFSKELTRQRNFSQGSHCMLPEWKTSLASTKFGMAYRIGSLFAASFYWAATKTPGGRNAHFDTMVKSIINAYDDEDPKNPGIRQLYLGEVSGASYLTQHPGKISLEDVSNVFLSHISHDDLRCNACKQMIGRLKLSQGNTVCNPSCYPNASDEICPGQP